MVKDYESYMEKRVLTQIKAIFPPKFFLHTLMERYITYLIIKIHISEHHGGLTARHQVGQGFK